MKRQWNAAETMQLQHNSKPNNSQAQLPPKRQAETQNKFVVTQPRAANRECIPPAISWSEPLPFIDDAVQMLRRDILPDVLGAYAQALTKHTETPSELSTLAVLSVVSTAGAGKVEVEAEPGYLEPVNLYLCPVLESGNRKTSVINAATRPLVSFQVRQRDKSAVLIAKVESERKTRAAIIERLRKKVADNDEAEIERIAELEAGLPVVPPLPVVFTSDTTAERLEVLLAANDGKVAVISDEGGPFDVMAGRYNPNPNLDVFLKGHSCSPICVERMGRQSIINRPTVTIFLSPQPSVLTGMKEFMRGRGLLARFIFALPASPVGSRQLVPSAIANEVKIEYEQLVTNILQWQPSDSVVLHLVPAAYQEWKEFQLSVEKEMADGARLCRMRDWGSKLPGTALRIAGLLHLAKHADHLSVLSADIGELEMQIALEMCAVFISHAIAVLGMLSEDPVMVKAKRVMRWLRKQGDPGGITKRVVFRAHQPHVFETVEQLDSVLAKLTEHGLIKVIEEKGAGRSSTKILVNPGLQDPPQ